MISRIFWIFTVTMLHCFFAQAAPPKTIHWVISHEPATLFLAPAKNFAKDVERRTGGEIQVKVLTFAEYAKGKKIYVRDILNKVQDGEIEMSQTFTTELGKFNKQFWALDLPFLFRDHGHATRVLEGQVGQTLLASLNSSKLQGLAFTYSGGYRIIPSVSKEIHKVEDLAGLKVQTSISPVAQAIMRTVGAQAVPGNIDDANKLIKNLAIDGLESTYQRYLELGHSRSAPVLNDTGHSLFLTSILMNKNFFQSLSKKHQNDIAAAALAAARVERETSVAEIAKTKNDCVKRGVKIVSLSSAEKVRFEKAVEPVYQEFAPVVGADLVTSIKDTL